MSLILIYSSTKHLTQFSYYYYYFPFIYCNIFKCWSYYEGTCTDTRNHRWSSSSTTSPSRSAAASPTLTRATDNWPSSSTGCWSATSASTRPSPPTSTERRASASSWKLPNIRASSNVRKRPFWSPESPDVLSAASAPIRTQRSSGTKTGSPWWPPAVSASSRSFRMVFLSFIDLDFNLKTLKNLKNYGIQKILKF